MYIKVINQSMGDKHGLGIRVLSWVQWRSPGLRARASSMLVGIEMDPHLICRGRLLSRAPFSGSIHGLHSRIHFGLHGKIRDRLRSEALFSGSMATSMVRSVIGTVLRGPFSGSKATSVLGLRSWAPFLGSVSGSMAIPTGSVLGLHWLGAARKSLTN
jgi:hypothetical protein